LLSEEGGAKIIAVTEKNSAVYSDKGLDIVALKQYYT
jgi:glutamate dehydrogenase/leucine dehydrogenase